MTTTLRQLWLPRPLLPPRRQMTAKVRQGLAQRAMTVAALPKVQAIAPQAIAPQAMTVMVQRTLAAWDRAMVQEPAQELAAMQIALLHFH